MSEYSTGFTELPRSAYLDNTLRRARSAAEQRSHRYVTLEHLLMALLDDPDALRLLNSAGADIPVIHTAAADTVNHRMAALAVPDGRAPSFSYKFDSLFLGASEEAMRIGRREVDGALALLAVAKDTESVASTILAANGFQWPAAMHLLGAGSAAQPIAARPSPSLPPVPSLAPAASLPGPSAPAQTARAGAADNLMEDMLASVRNILDAEERKERGLPASPVPPAPPQPANRLAARAEPQLRVDGVAARQNVPPSPHERIAASSHDQTKAGRGPRLDPGAGFESGIGATGRQSAAKRKGREPKGGAGQSELLEAVSKVFQDIPRKIRVGEARRVRLQIAKEEMAQLLSRAPRRGQPQLSVDGRPLYRAVTVCLLAPEGGFLIEPSEPETQWIVERPSAHGEETFGIWEWTAVPDASGSYILALSISARDIDANGAMTVLQLPEQAVKVRVRGGSSIWGVFLSLLQSALLLLSGSGLTVAAWYVLKMTGKLPH